MTEITLTLWNIFFVGAIHFINAKVFSLLPKEYFCKDDFLTKARAFEKKGLFWDRYFKVKSWKKKLPDAASLFGFGFSKKNLQSREPQYLKDFLIETRRAEWSHLLAICFAPLAFLFNPSWAAWVIVGYFLLSNLPMVITQRYNRFFIKKLLRFSSRI